MGKRLAIRHWRLGLKYATRGIIGMVNPWRIMTGIASSETTRYWVRCHQRAKPDSQTPLEGQNLPMMEIVRTAAIFPLFLQNFNSVWPGRVHYWIKEEKAWWKAIINAAISECACSFQDCHAWRYSIWLRPLVWWKQMCMIFILNYRYWCGKKPITSQNWQGVHRAGINVRIL